jgi:flagellar biosynthesis/type III secretory pathway M-ring protein FliF/YscJ
MLDLFNNIWVILICIILVFFIVRKIIKLNKPFDEERFIEQYKNQQKLSEKFSMVSLQKSLPKLTSFYLGI